jgi:hypothetical protein
MREATIGVSDRSQVRKSRVATKVGASRFCNCTKSCHTPVDVLYSIENKRNKDVKFLLTSLTGGVKTHSFFDKFPASGKWLVLD